MTNFDDPVPRTISTQPSVAAIIRLAHRAYVRGDIEADILERCVGIALGLEDGDVAILSGGQVVIPVTYDDHRDALYRLDERFAGMPLPDWAREQWELSAAALERLGSERAEHQRRRYVLDELKEK